MLIFIVKTIETDCHSEDDVLEVFDAGDIGDEDGNVLGGDHLLDGDHLQSHLGGAAGRP